jgi:hypothetical protein
LNFVFGNLNLACPACPATRGELACLEHSRKSRTKPPVFRAR